MNNLLYLLVISILTISIISCGSDSSNPKPTDTTPTQSDSDGDGVNDDKDAFPNDASETADLDNDGIGNNADNDADGDSIDNSVDSDDFNSKVSRSPVTLSVGDIIDFEQLIPDYAIESFGNMDGSLINDNGNTVLNSVKPQGSSAVAGNIMGKGNFIYPLSTTDSIMSANVFSTVAVTIRMKLENSLNADQSAEVDSTTDHGGTGWEVLYWNFAGTDAIDANFDTLLLLPNFNSSGAGNRYQYDNITFTGGHGGGSLPTPAPTPVAVVKVGESSQFSIGPTDTWKKVFVLALKTDGVSSRDAQTLEINITKLPEGGANYRVYKTTTNGNDSFGQAKALVIGDNTITVANVGFNRSVKVQFSSAEISFDKLSRNQVQLYPEPVNPEGVTLDQIPEFYNKSHAIWVKVMDLVLTAAGASSQATQTLSMHITELPEGGANYRVYKTTANGNDFFGPANALVIGDNTITVASVGFNRAVKVQFSSAQIRTGKLSLNGDQLYP